MKTILITLFCLGGIMAQNHTTLENYVAERINEFDQISKERKELLIEFADYIKSNIEKTDSVRLTFICTHNSRRSHMSQIWAQVAADHFGFDNVYCYSGGTEATAFNSRAVKAVSKTGIDVTKTDDSKNPLYEVKYKKNKEPLKCFSKVYNDEFNPSNNFVAVMSCSHADKNCPYVSGASARFPISFNDPKEFDGTELEEAKYDERCRDIAREMFFVFANVK